MSIDFNIMREPGFYNRIQETREKDLQSVLEWINVDECPVCKSKDVTEIKFKKKIPYAVCCSCEALYAKEIPSILNHAEYNIGNINDLDYDEKKREYKQERFVEERINLIKQHSNKPLSNCRLLDFGCGTGVFLEKAKDFFETVVGVEDSKYLREYINDKFKIDTYQFLPDEKFDVITLFDVLEHLKDPYDILCTCKKLLNDKGVIFIYTPNWRSLEFDILKEKNTQYFPSEHLWFASLVTLYQLAHKLDMNIVYDASCGLDCYDVLAYIRDIKGYDINEYINFNDVEKIQDMINELGKGNHLRIMLRK